MTPLADRKRLLIAESNRNREQLSQNLVALAAGVRAANSRASGFGSIASSAALLVTGVIAALRSGAPTPAPRHPWVSNLLKGASLASTLWLAFRSRSAAPRDP
jgi:hypothetical protein